MPTDNEKSTARLLRMGEDEDFWALAHTRGCATLYARISDGRDFILYVCDPVRLGQDIETTLESQPAYGEDSVLIVVPEVTRERVDAALQHLHAKDFFDYFVPLKTTAEKDYRRIMGLTP